MKKWHIAVAVLIGMIVVLGVAVWAANYVDALNALRHDTKRWAVIEDSYRDRMAVEPSSNDVWSDIVHLNQNGTIMFVGGIVERYNNKWGFRFKPDTVSVAQFTAEGLQATIRYVSENIEYWLNGWAYVSSRIVEIHLES